MAASGGKRLVDLVCHAPDILVCKQKSFMMGGQDDLCAYPLEEGDICLKGSDPKLADEEIGAQLAERTLCIPEFRTCYKSDPIVLPGGQHIAYIEHGAQRFQYLMTLKSKVEHTPILCFGGLPGDPFVDAVVSFKCLQGKVLQFIFSLGGIGDDMNIGNIKAFSKFIGGGLMDQEFSAKVPIDIPTGKVVVKMVVLDDYVIGTLIILRLELCHLGWTVTRQGIFHIGVGEDVFAVWQYDLEILAVDPSKAQV